MRNDIILGKDKISCQSGKWDEDFHESIFFTGNGRIGMRGYLPCQAEKRPLKSGLYIAGIFEEIKGGITDIVHLPTPVCEEAYLNGEILAVNDGVKRCLDLKNGIFSAEYTLGVGEKRLNVRHERFAALDNLAYIVQRTFLTAEADISFEWRSGISLSARNNPVPDDQVKSNEEIICLFAEEKPLFGKDSLTLNVRTPKTGLKLSYHCSIACGQNAESLSTAKEYAKVNEFAGLVYHINLKKGESISFEKFCFIQASRDVTAFAQYENQAYSYFEAQHKAAWAKRWENIALPSFLDKETEAAANYLAMQLVMNGNAIDETVSIGARGLTHPRYKGCYFWDTDFFLLPFYLKTHPKTARNLIRYRILNLPAAKEHAAKTSAKGARYPWMASFDGSEQCESWDIGFSEIHITADVVFAIDDYIKKTGDESLYPDAYTVYIETARFFSDRSTRDIEGNANLLFVKGPDEYCGITNNNLFTNMLVKHNLKLAITAAGELSAHYPDLYSQLLITEDEVSKWKNLENDLPIARNKATGRLQQDDTFHLLEPIEITKLKNGDGASYHQITFDRVQRYKVIKQADLLLLMTRMPEIFTAEERIKAWEDYEPVCLHDSTLSFASHALFAAQNGLKEKAEFYLNKALFLDLHDLMGNTGKEGLHLANFGECWQALASLDCGSSPQ
ncbi:MAG: glycoside hydrolase family 65 protein [Lachnospiraceae bacterium]|nr:glycoside hydrolase family 65 protein [Lachnospiraceae bacterium]